jgi:hypothetical protein
MSALDPTGKIESPNLQPAQPSDVNALHTATFGDPKAFLQVLQTNFNEISGGADSISLPDLIYEESHGSTAQIREASTIAAEHLSQLGGISDQQSSFGVTSARVNWELNDTSNTPEPFSQPHTEITPVDLSYALDMVQGKTAGYTASNLFGDGMELLGGAAVTAVGAGGALAFGVFTPEAFVANPVVGVGVGAGAVASGAFALYGLDVIGDSVVHASKNIFGQVSEAAKEDNEMISSWLTPSS